MFCHAGGIIILTARNRSTPPAIKTSSILSILEESEPVRLTNGLIFDNSGSSLEENFELRATDQLRLPSIVLISPLWAIQRKG